MSEFYSGGCNCGSVRIEARGKPTRVGLCHCMTCRRETGSAFMTFAVWDRSQVNIAGVTQSWIKTTDHRHFCPTCGSPLFATHDSDSEIEIRIGCLDAAPSNLAPEYELWTPRRERWMSPIAECAQYKENRSWSDPPPEVETTVAGERPAKFERK